MTRTFRFHPSVILLAPFYSNCLLLLCAQLWVCLLAYYISTSKIIIFCWSSLCNTQICLHLLHSWGRLGLGRKERTGDKSHDGKRCITLKRTASNNKKIIKMKKKRVYRPGEKWVGRNLDIFSFKAVCLLFLSLSRRGAKKSRKFIHGILTSSIVACCKVFIAQGRCIVRGTIY